MKSHEKMTIEMKDEFKLPYRQRLMKIQEILIRFINVSDQLLILDLGVCAILENIYGVEFGGPLDYISIENGKASLTYLPEVYIHECIGM